MRFLLLPSILLVSALSTAQGERSELRPDPVGTRLLDLDGDGALDLLVQHGDGSLLVRQNAGARRFLDVVQELPRVTLTDVLCGDLDGDAQPDLYLVSPGADVALLGLGDGRFREATEELGLSESGAGIGAERLDVDGDGLLDLVLHNQGSDVLFWARADGRFEREARTSDGVVSTVGIPRAVLVDAGQVVPHEEPASDRSSAGGRPSVAASPGAPAGPAGLVAAPSPTSSPAPLMAISFDARYVNDNQNEVDSADIVDGTLTGADISTSSGDVGVGTTAPSAKLDVVGETELNGVVNINGPAIEDTILNINNGNSPGGIYIAGSNPGANPGIKLHNKVFSENFRIRHNSSNQLSFQNSFSGLEIMTMSTGGNVGIGTASPSERLTVQTALGSRGFVQRADTVSVGSFANGSGGWYGTFSNHDLIFFVNNSFGDAVLTAAGDFGIGTLSPSFKLEVNGSAHRVDNSSTWTVTSDERLKKNIHDLEGALETVLALRGVTFEYKDPARGQGLRRGFIAQEVEKALPEWVAEGEDGYKLLNMNGFEALAVEALRELHDENAELRAANEVLEARVAALESLESELASLKQSVASLVGAR